MRVIEERPVEMRQVTHDFSCPRRPASASPRTRRRRAGSRRSACRSPAPGPRRRAPRRSPMFHSWCSIFLVIACAKRRSGRQLRQRAGRRRGQQLRGRDERLKKPQARALLGAHRAPGVQQLRGAALADDARQDRAGAHVAAGEPDAHEEERGPCARGRRKADSREAMRDDRARAGAHAVHRRDDRLRAGAHRA